MKRFFTLLGVSVVLLVASAFKAIPGIDDVVSALRKGNAAEVSKYMDDSIELSLPNKSDSYSKAQAVMILRDFFANNSVLGFEEKHKADNNGNQFCIGTLKTRSGEYRTTVFMKTRNGKQTIKEIRFQPL